MYLSTNLKLLNIADLTETLYPSWNAIISSFTEVATNLNLVFIIHMPKWYYIVHISLTIAFFFFFT